jgi:translation elongation factor P/translation initiation factor 5A
MANTSDISRGMILSLDGSLYSVVEFGENKTARAAAKVWAKLKGVDNSRSIEKNLEFRRQYLSSSCGKKDLPVLVQR